MTHSSDQHTIEKRPPFETKNLSGPSSTLHPTVLKLLLARNLQLHEVNEFLSWNLRSLPDLTQMKDMAKASQRILEAMQKGEKIGIYGDYDVDGTTSCALLAAFFQMIGEEVSLFQPSRFIEGYGIHPSSIDDALAKEVKVLVTVDCGITNNETALYALEKGVDLIITDHHTDAREELPRAFAVINPNRRDEPLDSPLRKLAGVGVAFALCVQIKNDLAQVGVDCPSLYPLLQFVAIGTLSDLAELTPLNLKLVRHGLKQLPQSQYVGLLTFLNPDERRQSFTGSEKISFHIGPLINSKGRLDHPEMALNLLLAKNFDEAHHFHSQLVICNNQRKMIQNEVFKEAKEQFLKDPFWKQAPAAVVYAPHWHEGVIGIVASKLVETFNVPAIVFTDTEDKQHIKASVRSAGELNIFEILKACASHFVKFGGHKAAAGLTMAKQNLGTFKEDFFQLLKLVPEETRKSTDKFDLWLEPQDVSADLLRELEKLEPFGRGNERPLFRMKNIRLDTFTLLKDIHVRWSFMSQKGRPSKLTGISFHYMNKWQALAPAEILQRQEKEELIIQFGLGINRFNGKEYIQLLVDKLSFES